MCWKWGGGGGRVETDIYTELAVGAGLPSAERGREESGPRPEVAPRGVLGVGSRTSLHPPRLTDGSAAQAQAVRSGRCQGRTLALLCALLCAPGGWGRLGGRGSDGESRHPGAGAVRGGDRSRWVTGSLSASPEQGPQAAPQKRVWVENHVGY